MISWTEAGAVERPTTLQVRLQRSYPGRVRAGAPVPTRSMSTRDVLDNIRHFTQGQRGPRGVPCDALVLSGVGVVNRPDLLEISGAARRFGVRRITLHTGGEDLEQLEARLGEQDGSGGPAAFDHVVVPFQPVAVGRGLSTALRSASHCKAAGTRVTVNTVLTQRAVERLQAVARGILRLEPDSVVFTYPFPVNGNDSAEPPPVARTLAALRSALALLVPAGIQPRIKGLPACYLGEDSRYLGRTSNRWYVDADHQLDDALLFFPEVVSFHKEEICRFCSVDGQCDGFFATYLRRPGFPPLDPLD